MNRARLTAAALLLAAAAPAFAPPALAQSGPNASGANLTRVVPPYTSTPEREQRTGAYGFLADLSSGFVTVQTQYSANIISDTFAAALRRSRDTVRADSKPIPEAVVQGLMPFYPESLLRNVRYAIGDTSQTGLAGFAIRNGNAAAVTLIDTVVFKDENFVSSLALWAHEIHHVQQYADWGLAGFAARYAFGWAEVEAEASARAKAYVAWYRERQATQKSPQ